MTLKVQCAVPIFSPWLGYFGVKGSCSVVAGLIPGIANIVVNVASRQPEANNSFGLLRCQTLEQSPFLYKWAPPLLKWVALQLSKRHYSLLQSLNVYLGLYSMQNRTCNRVYSERGVMHSMLMKSVFFLYTADFGDFNRYDSQDFLQKLALFPIVSFFLGFFIYMWNENCWGYCVLICI